MTASKTQDVNEKVIALILVSLFFAWRIQCHSATQLSKLDSMNPTDYIQITRQLYQQSYLQLFTNEIWKAGALLGIYELLVLSIRWFQQRYISNGAHTLEFMTGRDMVLKLVALVLVVLCFAWYTQNYNSTRLAKLDSMNPTVFIQHNRQVCQSPYLAICILQLFMSGLFIGSIKVVVFAIKLCIPKKSAV